MRTPPFSQLAVGVLAATRAARRLRSTAVVVSEYAHAVRPAVALLAVVAALLAPGAALAVSQAPPQAVVGAGTIDVPVLVVRSAPSAGARVVTRLTEFRAEDYRPRAVLALATKQGKLGSRPTWYKIAVPGRPNGRVGWVQARSVTIKRMPWQVVVYRGSKVIQVWKDGSLLYQSTVAVGAPGMETPTGLYYVTMRFKPVRQPFLGAYAFETSAYSRLSEWPGGGVVGVHGTTQPWLLGKEVSHGCIRISNAAAEYLRARIPVGTPIRVLPG